MQEISPQIIEQAGAGDRAAFEQIYKAACGFVYTLAWRILENQADAEEVTQEVFIKIYHSLKKFEFRSSFKTWLYRVATNTAINVYRKKAKERSRRFDFDLATKTQEAPDSPLKNLEKQEREKIIQSLLSNLPEKQRACILLRENEGLSYQEIAFTLKTNINTVRTWLKRGRQALLNLKKDEVTSNGL
jgi:RNA polymerase sigma-70 factor (ECF subfamily)